MILNDAEWLSRSLMTGRSCLPYSLELSLSTNYVLTEMSGQRFTHCWLLDPSCSFYVEQSTFNSNIEKFAFKPQACLDCSPNAKAVLDRVRQNTLCKTIGGCKGVVIVNSSPASGETTNCNHRYNSFSKTYRWYGNWDYTAKTTRYTIVTSLNNRKFSGNIII